MDIISDVVQDKTVREDCSDRSDSPEPKHEEVQVQVLSEVQVHAPAEEQRSSPTYMDVRDGEEGADDSSSSSSDDEEEKEDEKVEVVDVREVVEVKEVKEVVEVMEEMKVVEVAEVTEQVKVEDEEEVSGDTHSGSRRSSASSASSASSSDHHEEMQEENTQQTLENVTLDESSAAPSDRSHPEISLFVKVRLDQLIGRFLPSVHCVSFKWHESQTQLCGRILQ